MRSTSVFARTRFEALHNWPSADPEVVFLIAPHRHEFHVELDIDVKHDDREIEFIQLKWQLNDFLQNGLTDDARTPPSLGAMSCEMIAEEVVKHFTQRYPGRMIFCEVSEDGENGASIVEDGE